MRHLYYGDNLDVLRKRIRDETVDLCYIDPPFNSKKNYNQIYNSTGEDRAQAQAFIDTWTWDRLAEGGLDEILANDNGRFTRQTVELIKGLLGVLGKGPLLAYLVSITLRVTEIHRVLKPTGSFYLHCDPTASHYLKLVCDGIFCGRGGCFRNEIVWCYRGGGSPKSDFGRRHDVIFRYSKDNEATFNPDHVRVPYEAEGIGRKDDAMWGKHKGTSKVYKPHPLGKIPEDWWPINVLNANDPERLGYPTQKPEALLERIIKASSNEGDIVLDAYCGCGTTVAVAERLKRRWIGIDITYQAIAVILKRLVETFGDLGIIPDGIPRDRAAAEALATKKDDRTRKEFEKWAVLTYTNNRGMIFEKKGADKGIDGLAYFMTGHNENAMMVIQVKSGKVSRGDIAKLNSDRLREGAELATLITLQEPTKEMTKEALAVGTYHHEAMGQDYSRIQIVTIDEILEGKRMPLPLALEVLKAAKKKGKAEAAHQELDLDEDY